MMDNVFGLTPDNLSVVYEETLLLSRLVDELRTLSLADAGELTLNREPVDLATLAGQAVAAFEPLAEAEGVQLTSSIPAGVPPTNADAARLQQVLGNLLSNALRHALRSDNGGAAVHLQVQPRPGSVEVSVADNGPGLSPEAQAHVFDRFWRADAARSRDRGGSGLGLAICRSIVTAHGGQIWVTSEPGRGQPSPSISPPTPHKAKRGEKVLAPRIFVRSTQSPSRPWAPAGTAPRPQYCFPAS